MAVDGPAGSAATRRRIGLWGATQSGKTTMLAALQIAAGRQSGGKEWMVVGTSAASSGFLGSNIDILTKDKKFPEGTTAVEELSWLFCRPDPAHRGIVRWLRKQFRLPLATGQQEFEINMLDVGGYMFHNNPPEVLDDPYDFYYDDEDAPNPGFSGQRTTGENADEVIRNLADCDGLIYLFDPVIESREQNSYQHFARVLNEIARISHGSGRIRDGRLPHHLAVCINKIDHPTVYRKADQAGYLLPGENELLTPEVPPEYAQELFELLCSSQEAGSAEQVLGVIKHFFDPSRVAYFATSSVGFYVRPGRHFRPGDYKNVLEEPNKRARIRGEIRPVNVLEPFLWLEQALRRNPPPEPPSAEPAAP